MVTCLFLQSAVAAGSSRCCSVIVSMLLKAQISWTGHVIRMTDSHIPRQLLYGDLMCSLCTPGKPKLRFRETLKSRLKWGGISPRELEASAADRSAWRSFTSWTAAGPVSASHCCKRRTSQGCVHISLNNWLLDWEIICTDYWTEKSYALTTGLRNHMHWLLDWEIICTDYWTEKSYALTTGLRSRMHWLLNWEVVCTDYWTEKSYALTTGLRSHMHWLLDWEVICIDYWTEKSYALTTELRSHMHWLLNWEVVCTDYWIEKSYALTTELRSHMHWLLNWEVICIDYWTEKSYALTTELRSHMHWLLNWEVICTDYWTEKSYALTTELRSHMHYHMLRTQVVSSSDTNRLPTRNCWIFKMLFS